MALSWVPSKLPSFEGFISLFSGYDELLQIGLFTVTLLANGVAISTLFLFFSCLCSHVCLRVCTYRKKNRCAIINVGYMCSGSSRVGIVKARSRKLLGLRRINSRSWSYVERKNNAEVTVITFSNKIVLAISSARKDSLIY